MTNKSLHNTRALPDNLDDVQAALKPLVDDPSRTVLFLDLDGTLVPIMPNPEDVAVPPAVGRLLRELAHRYLAVTVVSGRQATEAMRVAGNSELIYVGNHGLETLLPGHAAVVCDEAQPYVKDIRNLIQYCDSLPVLADMGIAVEDKMATAAIHYRRAADPGHALAFIREKILPRVEELGLEAREGRMVIDVRPPVAVDKGVAVGRLMDRLNASQALYAGDDTTDVDALKELRRRRRKKQLVVGIGVISEEMPGGLPRYADLLVERTSGVETVLQILAGEEL